VSLNVALGKLVPSLSRRKLLSIAGVGLVDINVGSATSRPQSTLLDDRFNPLIAKAQAHLDAEMLTQLALGLANIPSPLGQEAAVAEYLCERMYVQGISARLQSFAPSRSNVLGSLQGRSGARTLMLNGHLETGGSEEVGVFPRAKIVNGSSICGRGIWNMKGALASFVAAVSAIKEASIELPGNVLIAASAGAWDEAPVETRLKGQAREGYGVGMKFLLDHGAVADFAIVGEPTSFKIGGDQFGTSMIRVDVTPKEPAPQVEISDLTCDNSALCNPAFLRDTTNVVDYSAEIIESLKTWIQSYQQRNVASGAAPSARLIASETAPPWSSEAESFGSIFMLIHTVPSANLVRLLADIRDVIDRIPSPSGLQAKASYYSVSPGSSVNADCPILVALQHAHNDTFGANPRIVTVPWYSDASPLNRFGIPAINYGPAGKYTSESECVLIKDLVRYAYVCINLIVRICGGA